MGGLSCTKMSAVIEILETRTSDRREQPIIVCALVAAGVVVGFLLFEHWWTLHGLPWIGRHGGDSLPFDVLVLIAVMVPYALLAVVLGLWGIDGRHRLAGAVGAVVAGLVEFGLRVGFQHLVVDHDHLTQNVLRTWDWVLTLTTPTLITIAWGLARRRGGVWWLGVLVTPVLAALRHEAALHWTTWQSWEIRQHQWWVIQLEFFVPIILGCVACWLLEIATTRRTSSEPTPDDTPEMQSSA
jgi:hypothetical protein